MTGLTDRAGGSSPRGPSEIEHAHQRWEESMLRQIEGLRKSVRLGSPQALADRCGGSFEAGALRLAYWGRPARIVWPALEIEWAQERKPCSTFDAAMLLYYLHSADGSPMADRWISFRELPDGVFYVLAYQRYSGDRLAGSFGQTPPVYDRACRTLGGWSLPAINEHAFAFQPLPRIRLASVLWPGDDEFPPRAHILFDAAASHYMTTDGLALLGGGLAGRLVRSGKKHAAEN
jgi:hypothetical protein